jgi:hypothetical protein
MTFEENVAEIGDDVASLGFDLPELIKANRLSIDYVRVERSEIEETGEYDLEGLFVRLDYAIRRVGARRVVLDTIESLFAGLSNDGILRSELRRLPPRRTLPVLSLRGVAAAAPPEHALHRRRSRAVAGRRPAEIPRRPAVALRARDPPGDDAPDRGSG